VTVSLLVDSNVISCIKNNQKYFLFFRVCSFEKLVVTRVMCCVSESLELRQLSVGGQTPQLSQVRAGELIQGKPAPLSLRSFCAPAGLAVSPRHQLTLAADVSLAPGDDFRCVLRTRLFGKG